MLLGAGCSRAPQAPQAGPGNQTAPEKPASPQLPFTPPAPAPFRIYYEKDAVPEALLAAWKPETRPAAIEQKLLQRSADGKWPEDGDLYVISPRDFAVVSAGVKFHEFADREDLEGVNAEFMGHPFDPQNLQTRPWRWTPYVFYVRHNEQDKPVKFEFHEWSVDGASLWPADWNLLLGIQLRSEGKSINLRLPDRAARLEKLAQLLAAHSGTEADCWQALEDRKIQRTLLPASWRLMHQKEGVPDNIQWFIPVRGTVTQFDHLAVRADSAQLNAALGLVKFLLENDSQGLLLQESGYFPVKSETGKELAGLPLKLNFPPGNWLNGSEFLVDCPVLPPPPATETAAKAGAPENVPAAVETEKVTAPVTEPAKGEAVPPPAASTPEPEKAKPEAAKPAEAPASEPPPPVLMRRR